MFSTTCFTVILEQPQRKKNIIIKEGTETYSLECPEGTLFHHRSQHSWVSIPFWILNKTVISQVAASVLVDGSADQNSFFGSKKLETCNN